MTNDGTKQYVWDAENRLIAVKQGSNTIAEYAYDYQSRRISKTVGSDVKSFVYDGWNPIAVFAGSTLDKSYTWGMDLSGSMQGAGGVGGLLSVNDSSQTYYPTFDGNGNVSEYVDSTGVAVAHYEYDAFGRIVASGTKKDDFAHQFSTKQLDSESGLHYYGYRYYDSSNGRWLGRDPIGTRGGLNLYSFIKNQSVSDVDVLGLCEGKVIKAADNEEWEATGITEDSMTGGGARIISSVTMRFKRGSAAKCCCKDGTEKNVWNLTMTTQVTVDGPWGVTAASSVVPTGVFGDFGNVLASDLTDSLSTLASAATQRTSDYQEIINAMKANIPDKSDIGSFEGGNPCK